MDLAFLVEPLERLDAWVASLLAGAPLPVALLLAAALGLRHATDPDHLLAVTSLMAAARRDVRAGARIGAWWGFGHAAVLVGVGVPLIAAGAALPHWLEVAAERLVGAVIVVLALRLLWRCARERLGPGARRAGGGGSLLAGATAANGRTGNESFAIGALHGLAGTGAVVLLLIAVMPSPAQAMTALALFAVMSVASMTLCTAAFAWAISRRATVVTAPALLLGMGAFGVLFGAWYAGIV